MSERIVLRHRDVGHFSLMGRFNKLFYASMTMIGHIGMIVLTYQFQRTYAFLSRNLISFSMIMKIWL